MNPFSTLSSLSQRLSLTLHSLRAVLASGVGRDPARVALLLLAWPYLHRLEARFASLVARIASGRVASGSVAHGRIAVAAPRPVDVALRERGQRQNLPRRFGWMIGLAPGVLPLASQVRHLLADPDMVALLAAVPQSARILRPLCRMLGVVPVPDLPPPRLPRRQDRSAATAAAPVTSPWAPVPKTPEPSAPAAPPSALSPPLYPHPA